MKLFVSSAKDVNVMSIKNMSKQIVTYLDIASKLWAMRKYHLKIQNEDTTEKMISRLLAHLHELPISSEAIEGSAKSTCE